MASQDLCWKLVLYNHLQKLVLHSHLQKLVLPSYQQNRIPACNMLYFQSNLQTILCYIFTSHILGVWAMTSQQDLFFSINNSQTVFQILFHSLSSQHIFRYLRTIYGTQSCIKCRNSLSLNRIGSYIFIILKLIYSRKHNIRL